MGWLKVEYKDRLVSVVEHTDEAHPHMHFYAIPETGEQFDSIHRGRRAAAEARAAGKPKGAQNRAYKEAMRGLQDDFWRDVGKRFGLARLGPGRRRLKRTEWHAEKQAADLLACEEQRATEIAAITQAALEENQRLKRELASAKDSAQAEVSRLKTELAGKNERYRELVAARAEREAMLSEINGLQDSQTEIEQKLFYLLQYEYYSNEYSFRDYVDKVFSPDPPASPPAEKKKTSPAKAKSKKPTPYRPGG